MAYEIRISNPTKKYLKKLQDKKLKSLFVEQIYGVIQRDPKKGFKKNGDLSEIYTQGFRYKMTDYRIAYKVQREMVIIIILVGSHANFYQELRRFL